MFWRKCAADQSFHFNSKSFFMDLQQAIVEWDRKCICMLFSWRCAFGFIIRSHLSTGFVDFFVVIQLISERCDTRWDIRRHRITVTLFAVCFFNITCHKILDTGPLFWKKSNIWSKKSKATTQPKQSCHSKPMPRNCFVLFLMKTGFDQAQR